ncbi:NfeD family protein [Marinicellulosiphila megalodicopiae]|uniref:NfeD family protein n=1 Tax=Marinicellulosiphila megalodicopiae TaxID=2724896 RepID=UPI003BB08F8F
MFELVYWHWLALGSFLLVLELAGAAGFLLWAGLAAFVSMVISFVFPQLDWKIQGVIYGVITLGISFFWYYRIKSRPTMTDQPNLNNRSQTLIGRQSELLKDTLGQEGKIKIDDANWNVIGVQGVKGDMVNIVGAKDSQTLIVEKV